MSRPKTLIGASVLAAAAVALGLGPAVADPIGGNGQPVTPAATDIVGVGSGVTQELFDQFSLDYNKTVKGSAPHLYSWDATHPGTGKYHDLITAKVGCALAPRPDDTTEGIGEAPNDPLGLIANTLTSGTPAPLFCVDFARSDRGRQSNDPPAMPGGLQFLSFAMDGVTYATNSTSNAPPNLSSAQLAEIYTCHVSNWRRVGGKNAPIDAQLPPASSDTRARFLTALGAAGHPIVPGKCVDDRAGEAPNNQPREDEGVSKFLQGPDVIFPFSIGRYLAEVYHSARCADRSCTPVKGSVCTPRSGQNRFGCNTHGGLVLHMINKTKPTVPFPLPAPPDCTKGCPVLNSTFSRTFVGPLFIVVRWTAGTVANIPSYIEPVFGPNGWCSTATARRDIVNYGFSPFPPRSAFTGGEVLKMTCP